MLTSAAGSGKILVGSSSLLFVGLGSGVVDVTVVVLVITPVSVGATVVTTVMVREPPTASVPRLQASGWETGGSGAGVAETKVSPAGKVSATVTFNATAGPAL